MTADHRALFDRFHARLEKLAGPDDLAEATVEASGPFGLGTVMAGAIHVRGDTIDARFHFGNWPGNWRDLYPREILGADPLVAEARRRIAPFTWTELRQGGNLSDDMRRALETTAAHGWHDGFAVPIHGPGGYTALVSFAGNDLALGPADRAFLLALAHAAHDRGRALAQSPAPAAELSRRELQVMRWVASGKTDWEIGQILGIAESTAHFHVEQAKRKLGVRSRGQAVGALILDGRL